jgi:hypothetical protein
MRIPRFVQVVLAVTVFVIIEGSVAHVMAKELNPCQDAMIRLLNKDVAFEQCFSSLGYVLVDDPAHADAYLMMVRTWNVPSWYHLYNEVYRQRTGTDEFYLYHAEYSTPVEREDAFRGMLRFIEFATPRDSKEIYFWVVSSPSSIAFPEIGGWDIDYSRYVKEVHDDGSVTLAITLTMVK